MDYYPQIILNERCPGCSPAVMLDPPKPLTAPTVLGRILEAAEGAKLSDSELGRVAGGKHPYQLVYSWKKGKKRPGLDRVAAIAQRTGYATEDFYVGAVDAKHHLAPNHPWLVKAPDNDALRAAIAFIETDATLEQPEIVQLLGAAPDIVAESDPGPDTMEAFARRLSEIRKGRRARRVRDR